ncbi:MAG: peptidoglycan DD-metalloendopeptidase family protein [Myxococcales bacterium]
MTQTRAKHIPGSTLSMLALVTVSSLAVADSAPLITGDRLSTARTRADMARSRAEEVDTRLTQFEAKEPALKARLTADGRALYRLGRNGMLPITGGLEGLLGHASRMQRLERMVHADLEGVASLQHELTRLRGEKQALALEVAQRDGDVASLERAQAAAIQQQIEQNLLGAAAPARRAPEPPQGDHMNYGLSVVGTREAERPRFADQRGALALPVSGPSAIQEATRAESGGPGLEFSTQRGAAVRAAAGGRVAFSDRYGSYGQLVILDHGDRYYTVYGGFAGVDVQVGDEVSKSARLGTSGTGSIYFEVRRGTKTEDARPWLGL